MVVAKGHAAIPIIVVTLFWVGIGAVIPWFVRGQNKRLVKILF